MAIRVRRDRQIKIEFPTEMISAGEPTISAWTTLLTTWAEKKDASLQRKEEVEAMSRTSSSYTEWIISYPPSILMPSTKMRIIELATNDIYDIENIYEFEKSIKEYLVLVCKQRQQK
jgi:hypothetical protein